MTGTEIQTDNLKLVLQTPERVLAWVEGMSPSVRAEISPDWLARVRALTSADPWSCFFSIVHRPSDVVIGQCGYKGPPGTDGVVEIAYGVDPEYQSRGYATEAARALVVRAFDTGQVRIVRAHTLAVENASTRVLTKCGFELIGEVVEPEDGLVWRWEIDNRKSQVESRQPQVDTADLSRFLEAQERDYDRALAEILSGRKRTHWMWYIFPQFAGLGVSPLSQNYAIRSLSEANAYITHPILGSRLLDCAETVLAIEGHSATEIFGSPDDLKLRSCATLFDMVSPRGSVFERLLAKYYDGVQDPLTLAAVRQK